MQPTLLILAAGMASRYGSMKQIQSFGPGGETIMDYSIYDAIRTGFGKVVFVIRKDFELYEKGILIEKHKVYVSKDGKPVTDLNEQIKFLYWISSRMLTK